MKEVGRILWDNEMWRVLVSSVLAGSVTPIAVQKELLGFEEDILWILVSLSFGIFVFMCAFFVTMIVKPPPKNDSSEDEPVER